MRDCRRRYNSYFVHDPSNLPSESWIMVESCYSLLHRKAEYVRVWNCWVKVYCVWASICEHTLNLLQQLLKQKVARLVISVRAWPETLAGLVVSVPAWQVNGPGSSPCIGRIVFYSISGVGLTLWKWGSENWRNFPLSVWDAEVTGKVGRPPRPVV